MSYLQNLLQQKNRRQYLENLPEKHFIDGQWVSPGSGQSFDSVDPGSEEVFAAIPKGVKQDINQAVESSAKAFESWKKVSPSARAALLRKLAAAVREHDEQLATVECVDSGKPLNEAMGDVNTAVDMLNYYAGIADKLQGESIPLGEDFVSFNVREPVGVTAHIVPWNFPLFTMVRGIAPALAAGCTAVVKPAETTSLSALMLADIMHKAGLPAGVLNVVTGFGSDIGDALTTHPLVRHITFTGSVATGKNVMRKAADNVSSVTLELGGKSPAVALSDADIDYVAEDMTWAIYYNAGQVCSAGSRLVIHQSRQQEFLDKFIEKIKQFDIGHGLKDARIGAINSKTHLDKVLGYLENARSRNIDIAYGGNAVTDPDSGKGYFVEPTVLNNLQSDDKLIQEEIFGPVLGIQVIENDEDAAEIANHSPFGLYAGIYTQNISKGLSLAKQIDAGQVTVNQYFAGGIYTPFGGNKQSGFGREKGLAGLNSYLKTKNITIKI